jgi:hypothetical protein
LILKLIEMCLTLASVIYVLVEYRRYMSSYAPAVVYGFVILICLFFFNCWAVQLFEILEDKCRAEEEVRNLMRKGVYGQRKIPCVRINLRPEGVNTGASTSGNVGSPSVASTTAKKTKPKK